MLYAEFVIVADNARLNRDRSAIACLRRGSSSDRTLSERRRSAASQYLFHPVRALFEILCFAGAKSDLGVAGTRGFLLDDDLVGFYYTETPL